MHYHRVAVLKHACMCAVTMRCQSQHAVRVATRRCHLQRYNSKPATLEQYARVKPTPAGVPAEGGFGGAMAVQDPVPYGQVQQGIGRPPAYVQHSDPYVPLGAYIERGVPESHSPAPPPHEYNAVSVGLALAELHAYTCCLAVQAFGGLAWSLCDTSAVLSHD